MAGGDPSSERGERARAVLCCSLASGGTLVPPHLPRTPPRFPNFKNRARRRDRGAAGASGRGELSPGPLFTPFSVCTPPPPSWPAGRPLSLLQGAPSPLSRGTEGTAPLASGSPPWPPARCPRPAPSSREPRTEVRSAQVFSVPLGLPRGLALGGLAGPGRRRERVAPTRAGRAASPRGSLRPLGRAAPPREQARRPVVPTAPLPVPLPPPGAGCGLRLRDSCRRGAGVRGRRTHPRECERRRLPAA